MTDGRHLPVSDWQRSQRSSTEAVLAFLTAKNGALLAQRRRRLRWKRRPVGFCLERGADPLSKCRPLHKLQHQRPGVVLFLDAVDGGNARMVQAGEDLRLALEPRRSEGSDRQDPCPERGPEPASTAWAASPAASSARRGQRLIGSMRRRAQRAITPAATAIVHRLLPALAHASGVGQGSAGESGR